MAQKIKFNIIQSLFRLFSFLADKTGGWIVFVKPKILLGSVALGLTACSSNALKQDDVSCYVEMPSPLELEQTDTTKVEVEKTGKSDSIVTLQKPILVQEPIDVYEPVVMCYDMSIEELPIVKVETEIDTTIYTIVEKMPSFPNGESEMRKFIAQNIKYPRVTCYEGGIEGRVVCQFIVEKDGSISNVEVFKSVDQYLDKAAVRVIESMPKWIPGENNGEKVRVKYFIPIVFKEF